MDLTLKITADGSDAKKELADVERGIKGVESASTKTGSSVSKVMQAMAGDTSKVSQAQDKLATATKALSGVTLQSANSTGLSGKALNDYYLSLVKSDAAVIKAAANQKVMAESTTAASMSMRVASLAANGWVIALGAVAAAGVGVLAFLAKSVVMYYEHSDAGERLSAAWDRMKQSMTDGMVKIGAAIVGGSTDIVPAMDRIAGAIVVVTDRIAGAIRRIQEWQHTIEAIRQFIPGMGTPSGAGDAILGSMGMSLDSGGLPGLPGSPAARVGGFVGAGDPWEAERQSQQRIEADTRAANEAKREQARIDAQIFAGMRRSAEAAWQYSLALRRATLDLQDAVIAGRQLATLNPAFVDLPHIAVTAGITGLHLPGSVPLSAVTGLPSAPQTLLGGLFGSSAGFGQLLSGSVLGAIQGGGNVAQSAGSAVGGLLGSNLAGMLTGGAGVAIGGLAGGALNAILPGAGMLLGPLLGKGIGAIGNLFNRDKGRDEVKGFAESFGGFDALHKELNTLGQEGEQLWIRLTQGVGRNNPAQAKAAIEAVTSALNRQTDQHARAEAAITKYGFSFEELGKKVQQSRITEMGDELRLDWEALISVGVDSDAIINRMSDSVSLFLQKAIQTGTEVPTAMRPMLQQMLEAGKLIGANGEKLEDLEDVTWAKSMTEGFKDVTDAIYELRDALVGVGGAMDDINSREVHIRSRVDAISPGDSPVQPEVDGVNSFARGTNGYQDFGRGRTVRLHGWEKVTPMGKAEPMVIQVNLGEGRFADIAVDTMTRKYHTRYRVGRA